jgi:hypothetical protein
MPAPPAVRKTVIQDEHVEIVIYDGDDPERATLLIQISARTKTNRDQVLALIEAKVLSTARNVISEQIQPRTQKHGPVA